MPHIGLHRGIDAEAPRTTKKSQKENRKGRKKKPYHHRRKNLTRPKKEADVDRGSSQDQGQKGKKGPVGAAASK